MRETMPGISWTSPSASHPGGEGFGQLRILDVPAEGVEPDLGGVEFDRRLAEQAAGIVDEPHHGERRGLPVPEPLQSPSPVSSRQEPSSRATVRPSRGAPGGPSTATRRPSRASASAAARPTAPAPTIAISTWLCCWVLIWSGYPKIGGLAIGRCVAAQSMFRKE